METSLSIVVSLLSIFVCLQAVKNMLHPVPTQNNDALSILFKNYIILFIVLIAFGIQKTSQWLSSLQLVYKLQLKLLHAIFLPTMKQVYSYIYSENPDTTEMLTKLK